MNGAHKFQMEAMACHFALSATNKNHKSINQEMHWQSLNLFAVQDMCKNLHYISDLSSLIQYNKGT
jgi:hypothetical protein